MKKIAVFGSAFNPPSIGHQSMLKALDRFDIILLEPSIAHPFGKQMLEYNKRCQLTLAFIQDLAQKNVYCHRFEEQILIDKQIQHKQLSDLTITTFELLTYIQKLYPQDEISFVIGPDNLFNFHKFAYAKKITQSWAIIMQPEKLAIRSSDVRNALLTGQSIDHLTTPSVASLLYKLDLYA